MKVYFKRIPENQLIVQQIYPKQVYFYFLNVNSIHKLFFHFQLDVLHPITNTLKNINKYSTN